MRSGSLLKEIRRMRAVRESEALDAAPADAVEFARLLGLEPDPWQATLLRSESPRVLLNCSRQSGKSTITAIKALHRALRRRGALILILAPAERQARETFGKVARFYRSLGYRPGADSDRKTGLELITGSRIEALPGSNSATIRGFSGVDLLILDEAARVVDELYYAVRPMLAVSGGDLIMLSTPSGRRGVFYEAWESDEAWERYEIPWTMCPRISPEFYEEESRSLPPWLLRQEYECSFEEDLNRVFPDAVIRDALTSKITPLFEDGSWPWQ